MGEVICSLDSDQVPGWRGHHAWFGEGKNKEQGSESKTESSLREQTQDILSRLDQDLPPLLASPQIPDTESSQRDGLLVILTSWDWEYWQELWVLNLAGMSKSFREKLNALGTGHSFSRLVTSVPMGRAQSSLFIATLGWLQCASLMYNQGWAQNRQLLLQLKWCVLTSPVPSKLGALLSGGLWIESSTQLTIADRLVSKPLHRTLEQSKHRCG